VKMAFGFLVVRASVMQMMKVRVFLLNSFYFVLFLIMETASDSSKGKRAYMRAF
jgi:hypothetical protein